MDIDGVMPYWAAARQQRIECSRDTLHRIPSLGMLLPEMLAALDPLLASLERVACCMDGCPGEDKPHVLQRLVGRGVSNSLAAMELGIEGHYDEALILARGIGEAANLGWLFAHVPGTYAEWLALDDRKRWGRFRPTKVRDQIIAAGVLLPIDKARYSVLSGETAHPTPETQPQRFNAEEPTIGGYYQEGGVFIALNEIAAAIAVLGASVVDLIPDVAASTCNDVKQLAAKVLENVGGITVMELSSVRQPPHNKRWS